MGDELRQPLLGIATPASWIQLDLDPRTRTVTNQRLVEERAEAFPEGAQFGSDMERSLEATLAAAQQQGGVFAAVLSAVSDGKPVGASVAVSLISRAATAGAAPVGDVRRALAEGLGERYAGPGTDVAVIDLAPGPATRVRWRIRADVPVGAGVPAVGGDVEQVQYFLPLPGATHLALLSFSTPNLELSSRGRSPTCSSGWPPHWTPTWARETSLRSSSRPAPRCASNSWPAPVIGTGAGRPTRSM